MNSRRSFLTRIGAGVSAALASTAGMARGENGKTDTSSLQVALLEEEKTLRKLHQAFEKAMDKGRYEDVIEMFADDAQVLFNGGIFRNRSRGVSRLYRGHFAAGTTGKRMEAAPGFELDGGRQQDEVAVSENRLSATAVFPYSIRVGVPVETDTSLASMARLHGEGVRTWWEGGVYNVTYRKNAADGRWMISRLEYNTLSRADYRAGRSWARPIAAVPFKTLYPEDAHGPDALA